MLSHRYEITSLLNHIKLYNTPAIKNSAPQERCSPDYFHVLFGAEHQHFCLMQISKKSHILTMNVAGRQTSFQCICVQIHSTYIYATGAHANYKESLDQIWIRTVHFFNLLECHTIFKNANEHQMG